MTASRGWFTSFDVPPALLDECHDAVRAVRSGSPVDGLRLARAILRRARAAGDYGSIIEAHCTVANCQAAHGDFIEAAANAMDAMDLAEGHGDTVGFLNALTTLAGASGFILDTLEPAAELLGHSIAMAEELGEGALEVRARNIRGIVRGNLGQFEESMEDFERAMAMIGSGGTNTPLRLVTSNYAHAHIKQAARLEGAAREPHWKRARELAGQTMAEVHKADDAEGESRLRFMLGELEVQQGNPGAALEEFARSRELGVAMKHRTRAIDAMMEIAKTHERMGDPAAALREFDRVQDEAVGLKPTRMLAEAAERAAGLHEAAGRADEAAALRQRARKEREEFERESRHTRDRLLALFQRVARRQARAV